MALAALVLALLLSPALAFDPVSIKDSNYALVATSPTGRNITWGWRVKLSNDTGEPCKVKLTVQLLDFSGYELGHASKSVRLDMWETKEVTGQKEMRRTVWDQVNRADYKLEVK
jgi:hypothetical protein